MFDKVYAIFDAMRERRLRQSDELNTRRQIRNAASQMYVSVYVSTAIETLKAELFEEIAIQARTIRREQEADQRRMLQRVVTDTLVSQLVNEEILWSDTEFTKALRYFIERTTAGHTEDGW